MKPGRLDITIYPGATYRRTLRLPGVDLTGATGSGEIRTKAGGQLLASFTVVITPGAEESTIELSIPAATTAAMTQSGVYDFFVEYADTTVDKLLVGCADLDPSITELTP